MWSEIKHQELVTGLAGLIEQLIAHTETSVDNTVIGEIHSAVEGIDTEAEPDELKLIESIITVLEEVSEITETDIDDKILGFIKLFFDENLWDKIQGLWNKRREKRKAKRAARRERRSKN